MSGQSCEGKKENKYFQFVANIIFGKLLSHYVLYSCAHGHVHSNHLMCLEVITTL